MPALSPNYAADLRALLGIPGFVGTPRQYGMLGITPDQANAEQFIRSANAEGSVMAPMYSGLGGFGRGNLIPTGEMPGPTAGQATPLNIPAMQQAAWDEANATLPQRAAAAKASTAPTAVAMLGNAPPEQRQRILDKAAELRAEQNARMENVRENRAWRGVPPLARAMAGMQDEGGAMNPMLAQAMGINPGTYAAYLNSQAGQQEMLTRAMMGERENASRERIANAALGPQWLSGGGEYARGLAAMQEAQMASSPDFAFRKWVLQNPNLSPEIAAGFLGTGGAQGNPGTQKPLLGSTPSGKAQDFSEALSRVRERFPNATSAPPEAVGGAFRALGINEDALNREYYNRSPNEWSVLARLFSRGAYYPEMRNRQWYQFRYPSWGSFFPEPPDATRRRQEEAALLGRALGKF